MLALLESCVIELHGTYAMEDTDSMAIVATESGGRIPCAGGHFRTKDRKAAVRALSWQQVEEISGRFKALNPYGGDAGRGSILKIEDDNCDPLTGKQRQLFCFAISAKRYALFLRDDKGGPVLLRTTCPFCGQKNKTSASRCKNEKCGKRIQPNNKEDRWSEHGLGHLLNPIDPESQNRDWIAQAWLGIVRSSLGPATNISLGFESAPAVGRISVSSPTVMKALKKMNAGKAYPDQIKPFNFLLTCHVKAHGHPLGVDAEHFHLISPYRTDSREWLKNPWIDQYSGNEYRIITTGQYGTSRAARVKTYGDVLREYEYHPESKCADAHGNISGKQTVGLLDRRHIQIDQIKYIGKESNSLEEVDQGLVHSAQNVYTEYVDPRRDEWQTKILPALQKAKLAVLVRKCQGVISRRALIDLRANRSRPQRKTQQVLTPILKKLGLL